MRLVSKLGIAAALSLATTACKSDDGGDGGGSLGGTLGGGFLDRLFGDGGSGGAGPGGGTPVGPEACGGICARLYACIVDVCNARGVGEDEIDRAAAEECVPRCEASDDESRGQTEALLGDDCGGLASVAAQGACEGVTGATDAGPPPPDAAPADASPPDAAPADAAVPDAAPAPDAGGECECGYLSCALECQSDPACRESCALSWCGQDPAPCASCDRPGAAEACGFAPP